VAVRIDRIAGAIKATHPEFDSSQLPRPRESGNGGAGPLGTGPRVRRQLRRGHFIIVGTAGGPAVSSFSTRYPA